MEKKQIVTRTHDRITLQHFPDIQHLLPREPLGGEVTGDTAILNPATITDHPPYDIHAPTFSAAELGWSISFLV